MIALRLVMVALLSLIVTASIAIDKSEIKAQNLRKVYEVGQEVGHTETLQAILLHESSGGTAASLVGNRESPIGKRSYGLMQVQVGAARSILSRYPELMERYFPTRPYKSLTDEEVIALLLLNDEANIRIAAYHFRLYFNLVKGDWEKAVAAYNVGIGGVKRIQAPNQFPYVVEIQRKIRDIVRPFNRKHTSGLTPE